MTQNVTINVQQTELKSFVAHDSK